MKKSFKTILGILFFVVIGTSVYSQDVFSVQSKIELNGSSEQSDMKIEVTIDKCHFDLILWYKSISGILFFTDLQG